MHINKNEITLNGRYGYYQHYFDRNRVNPREQSESKLHLITRNGSINLAVKSIGMEDEK